jgi:hypothetical protein
MDEPINEIIKNIIHIDKSAVQLREKLNQEIVERKLQKNSEIEKLRASILDAERQRIDEIEKDETHNAELEADKIKLAAAEKSKDMYNSFLLSKNDLVKEMFRTIISK